MNLKMSIGKQIVSKLRDMLKDKMMSIHRTIVIVDSNKDLLIEFQNIFQKDYNVVTFSDPLDAYDWFKIHTVDLVICNVSLPSISGISLVRKMKIDSELRTVPVILFTENMSDTQLIEAKRCNANDIYSLPLNYNSLKLRFKYLSKIQLESESIDELENNKFKPIPITKSFISRIFAALLFLISLPVHFIITLYLLMSFKNPYKMVIKIGQYYSRYKLIYFNVDSSSWIYRLNLYKLPLLINCIFFKLSIVGNKPLDTVDAAQHTSDLNSIRFLAPTGLTGLRQLKEASLKSLKIEESLKLERYYAENQSIWLDLKILLKSIKYLFKSRIARYSDYTDC